MCEGGTPSEGGEQWECGWLASRGTSVNGDGNSFPLVVCVFFR